MTPLYANVKLCIFLRKAVEYAVKSEKKRGYIAKTQRYKALVKEREQTNKNLPAMPVDFY